MRTRKEVQAVIFAKERFLLIKKYDEALGEFHWRLVKGGIEKGESEIEAVRREILEETGLRNVELIDKIYDYTYTFRDIKHKVVVYLVKADLSEKVNLSEKTISDYAWENPKTAIKILKWEDERNSVKTALRKKRLRINVTSSLAVTQLERHRKRYDPREFDSYMYAFMPLNF